MVRLSSIVLAAALVALLGKEAKATHASVVSSTAPKAAAQSDLTMVTSSELVAENVLDRSSVMMYYWGYVAGKAGITTFNTGAIESQTSKVMETCTGNPKMTLFAAIDASKHAK